jgi:chromate reductase
MDNKIKILSIVGSLRKDSFNRKLAFAAQKLAPANVDLEIFTLEEIPPFNQDLESNPPVKVIELKSKIKEAHAILFVSPEYNYSIPGVLKNAIDWASRPYGDSAWDGKPAAIMGGSPGMGGTMRMQYHLRQVMVFLNMFPLNRPEVMVPLVNEKFDKKGNLVDEHTKEKIKELLKSLVNR